MREFYDNPLDWKAKKERESLLRLIKEQDTLLELQNICIDIKPRQLTKKELLREKYQEILNEWKNEKNTVHKKLRHIYDLKKLENFKKELK